jgi:energy-coupling factor transporter ATP-binding protein EcfA2
MKATPRTLKLLFKKPYLSIKDLPEIELPAFSIITGINGSGKSHLLQAISKGDIEIAGLEKKKNSIRLFDWNSFLPVVGESANPHTSFQNRSKAIEQICGIRANATRLLVAFFAQRNLKGPEQLADGEWLSSVSEEKIREVLLNSNQAGVPLAALSINQFVTHFLQVRENALRQFKTHLGQLGTLTQTLEARISPEHPNLLSMDDEHLRESFPLQWAASDMLQLQFANWFTAWHAAWEYNRINRYYFEKGDLDRKWMTDDQFRIQYGPEPWDLTNKVLQEAGVRYRFNKPDNTLETLHENFQLSLTDPTDGSTISTQNLSPGEKIFLAVTLLLYQTEQLAVLTQLPSVILLDEVDAPLHPSLTRALIHILNTELVERCGTAIIMTTHSPSTVALAPANTVYEMVRHPRHLRPIKPSAASQILSSGFVSISPPDVIVITESGGDIEYYEPLYQALLRGDKIVTHPPLKFIPASRSVVDKASGGNTQVRTWAGKLAGLGIARFRGLIDKDAGVSGDKVITVINRYSFENYLFDPLTLFAYLVHRTVTLPFSGMSGFPTTATALVALESSTRQPILDAFFDWIATGTGNPKLSQSARTSCS